MSVYELQSSLHCLWLLELAHTLDMIHEVSSVNVLHHKVQPILQHNGYCPVFPTQRRTIYADYKRAVNYTECSSEENNVNIMYIIMIYVSVNSVYTALYLRGEYNSF